MLLHVGDSLGLLHLCLHMLMWRHLLWALIFLRTYTTESSLAVAIGVDEKTLQQWIFIIIYAISDLEDDWVDSLCSEDSSDISNNCFSTGQMGEHNICNI